MNGYVQTAFGRFKQFFLEAATVEPPNERFGYDEYTDVIQVTKPVIYISVKEIIRTHSVILYSLTLFTCSLILLPLSLLSSLFLLFLSLPLSPLSPSPPSLCLSLALSLTHTHFTLILHFLFSLAKNPSTIILPSQ